MENETIIVLTPEHLKVIDEECTSRWTRGFLEGLTTPDGSAQLTQAHLDKIEQEGSCGWTKGYLEGLKEIQPETGPSYEDWVAGVVAELASKNGIQAGVGKRGGQSIIQFIKGLRIRFGLPLKEAKIVADTYRDEGRVNHEIIRRYLKWGSK